MCVSQRWRSSSIILHLIFKTGFLTEPGTHPFSLAGRLASLWILFVSTSPFRIIVKRCGPCALLFDVLGIRARVLMLAWQGVISCCLPSPSCQLVPCFRHVVVVLNQLCSQSLLCHQLRGHRVSLKDACSLTGSHPFRFFHYLLDFTHL